VTEPGAVFGEISALLNCPHTADVRALATSEFHVAHPTAIQDPTVLLYVAKILARRLDDGNQALVETLVELKRETRSAIDKTIRNIDRLGAHSYLKEAEQLRRSEDDAAVLATMLEDIKAAGLIDSKPDKETKR
jgi:CRP-like cAMP-binding protein